MEKTSNESVNPPSDQQKKNWVKFDEDDDSVQPTEKVASNESVENGPHSTSTAEPPPPPSAEPFRGAIIDTTQVHVTLDKKQRGTVVQHPSPSVPPYPKPAPRTTVPLPVVNRSASSPNSSSATGGGGSIGPVPATRADTAIPMMDPMSPRNHLPPQRPPAPQRLQSIPLQEIINGATIPQRTNLRSTSNVLRQNFANGDVIVSMYPVNDKCPWLTWAKFRPELVPEELMAECLTLTVEEYVGALEVLVNDSRFNCYNMFYKRIMLFWILFGFIVLLALLFSGVKGLGLFGGGVVWLLLNAIGIFVCMWLKMKMSHQLEKCLAAVNKIFLRHKILLGLDDKGKLSCHKVNLIFVYFDCTDCVKKLNEVIDLYDKEPKETENNNKTTRNIQARMDIDDSDIIITGSTTTHVSRKQERAEKLLLRYSQRWVKEYVRHRLDLTVDVHDRGESAIPAPPRHCVHARCLCQYIEEHLKYKPRGKLCGCQLFRF